MKDRATQSPMRKFKAIEPTININRFKRYFGGFHFNQFGTLLGVPVSFVTNFEIRTTLVIWTEAKRVIYSKSKRVIWTEPKRVIWTELERVIWTEPVTD